MNESLCLISYLLLLMEVVKLVAAFFLLITISTVFYVLLLISGDGQDLRDENGLIDSEPCYMTFGSSKCFKSSFYSMHFVAIDWSFMGSKSFILIIDALTLRY